jgi:phosphoglucosamine mutase
MINVAVTSTESWKKKISAEMEHAETALMGRGRVVVRPSGTQPVIRVMVEADEYELRDRVADHIVDAMVREMGGEAHGRVDLTYALGD